MKKFCFLLVAILLFSKIQSQVFVINTVAGDSLEGFGGAGGPALNATLDIPTGIIIDKTGNLFFGDAEDDVVWKLDTNGIITVVAGVATGGYSGNGGPANAAMIDNPLGIAMDDTGNIYIAEVFNNIIRKVNKLGIISTFAGNHTAGFSGDGGPALSAQLNSPAGIAIDKNGFIFITELGNNCVRKISPSGIITTVAGGGTSGYSGDGGPALSAKFNQPFSILADTSGNLYVGDTYNHVIRKINNAGIITTIAGTGVAGYSGNGGPASSAQLNTPLQMSLDLNGNLIFCEGTNAVVRMIDNSGIIHTIAGTGNAAFSGDGGPATLANMQQPYGVAVSSNNEIFITDSDNHRVRKLSLVTGVDPIIKKESPVAVYPNPSSGIITVCPPCAGEISITNAQGQIIYRAYLRANEKKEVVINSAGIYCLQFAGADSFMRTVKVVITQ